MDPDAIEEKLELIAKEVKCPICLDLLKEPHGFPCNHLYCKECLMQALKHRGWCPLCRLPFFKRDMRKIPALDGIIEIYNDLKGMVAACKAGKPVKAPPKPPRKVDGLGAPALPLPPGIVAALAAAGTPRPPPAIARSRSRERDPPLFEPDPSPPVRATRAATHASPAKLNGSTPSSSKRPHPEPERNTPSRTRREDKRGRRLKDPQPEEEEEEAEDPSPVTPQLGKRAAPARQAAPLVFTCTGLSTSSIASVKQLAKLVGAEETSKWKRTVTHVIAEKVHNVKRTMKYLQGILQGQWVVSVDWVEACLAAGKIVPADAYEVQSDNSGGAGAPRTARIALSQPNAHRLFHGLSFYFLGEFMHPAPDKASLIACAEVGGGVVLRRDPSLSSSGANSEPLDASTIIIASETDSSPAGRRRGALRYGWLMDSIGQYSLRPRAEYTILT